MIRRARNATRAACAIGRAGVLATALAAALARATLAHGGAVPTEPPSPATLLLGWSFDPIIWLVALVAMVVWAAGVRHVNRAHPHKPVPWARTAAWVAGIAMVLVALDSGIERYATGLFSVHMVQHMLLTLVAPVLLVLAGPLTLLLRASSPAFRARWILPVLHSRAVRAASLPAVAWLVFAGAMWGSHFSPLFDAALENEWMHRLEHALFLGAALLFWWQAAGVDPSPSRLRPGARVLFAGLQMPQNTFLALAIVMAGSPLYRHYASAVIPWAGPALDDQQLAGGLMWVGGDLVFVVAVVLLVGVWLRNEERRTAREELRMDLEMANRRERDARLLDQP